ncbi:MAG: HD-GYP domain-containing protein [Brevinematia bacterium]
MTDNNMFGPGLHMKKISVNDLKEGMKFSKSVYDHNRNIILPANKPFDRFKINSLKSKGIEFVETAGEMSMADEAELQSIRSEFEPQEKKTEQKKIVVSKDTAKYIEFYKDAVTRLSRIYKKVQSGLSVDPDELQKITTLIVNTISSEKNQNNFINLVNVAGKGEYLVNHVINVTILSVLLGIRLGYSAIKLFNLALAALVYDIGMVRVPAIILEKESKLSPEEFNQIKTHPIHSYQIITKELGLPMEVARVALEHHERFDGSGYPRKLKGNEISEMTKIISIADTYEALIKDRNHREGKESYEAIKVVLGEGSKKMDPEILKYFISMMSIYPVGSYVELSDGSIAQVISSDPVSPFFPTVKIIKDQFKDDVPNGEVIRLSKTKDIYIVRSIKSKEIKNES